jgi:hypothetical protein
MATVGAGPEREGEGAAPPPASTNDPTDAHPDHEAAEDFGASEDEQRRVVGQPRDVAP